MTPVLIIAEQSNQISFIYTAHIDLIELPGNHKIPAPPRTRLDARPYGVHDRLGVSVHA